MVHHGDFIASLALLSAASVQGLQRSPLPISELRKQIRSSAVRSLNVGGNELETIYPEYNISVPIDYFHNDTKYEPHSDGVFNLRYWYDAQYYQEGGPVIVLQGGETSGADRLPYLQKGLLAKLARATNGIGVILEHRYYGMSIPTPDLSTENLRFLTTEQALADSVYFAQNVRFKGLEHIDLTSETTPYVAYGGSYAGAYVAFLRKQYPDVYWGAISSSGVTEAIYDYWQYYEAARIYGPPECVETTQKLTNVVDNILKAEQDHSLAVQLKEVFGLPNITYDTDFAQAISGGIAGLQGLNWDPAVSSNTFFDYCSIVSNDSVLYDNEALRPDVEKLLDRGGWGNETKLENRMLNYIGYVRKTASSQCQTLNQDECFGTQNSTFYRQDDISQSWRLWAYQYCTQWGYLQTGSGAPASMLPLISRTIDIPYATTICRQAFNITIPPDVEAINKYGGLNFSYPRVAIVDGEWDPWRAATPHAIGLPDRANTMDEPFILIEKGVHHWDENGLLPNETTATLPPLAIRQAQEEEVQFVTAWMKEWRAVHTVEQLPSLEQEQRVLK